MNWAVIRPALLALLQRVTTVPDANVVWEDQTRPYINPGFGANPPTSGARTILLCSIKGVTSQGALDELLSVYDPHAIVMVPGQPPVTGGIVNTSAGIRLFQWCIRCESLEQGDGFTAYQYLENIRTRLYSWPSSQAAFLAMNVAFYDDDPTQDFTGTASVVVDDRAASVAVLVCHMRTVDVQTDVVPQGTIADIVATGALADGASTIVLPPVTFPTE